jgi:hypothetical protein
MDEQLRDVNLGELIGLPAYKNVLANGLQIARGPARSGHTLDRRICVEPTVEAHQLRDVVVSHNGDV